MEYKKYILEKLKERIPNFVEEKKGELAQWKEYNNKKCNKIVIFGAGGMGDKCCNYFESLGLEIDFICDNNTNRQGKFVTEQGKSINVVPVDDLLKYKEKILCFVATGSHHFENIAKQLEKYNLAEVVYKWHLDFYLESMELACNWGDKQILDDLNKLLSFFKDEESLKIILCHLREIFELSIEEENLVDFKNFCRKPQYFLENGKYLEDKEFIVDCGAFIGDTLEDLVNVIGYENFSSYDCYELDNSNFESLKENIQKFSDKVNSRIYLHQCGVGSKAEDIAYSFNQGGTCIGINGEMQGRIVTLDKEFESKKISFLKMDIEGSEQDALKGAEKIVKRDKPMCAICVYHTIKAFWEIPSILNKYVPEYNFILRHHTEIWEDTVCYAKIGEWQ